MRIRVIADVPRKGSNRGAGLSPANWAYSAATLIASLCNDTDTLTPSHWREEGELVPFGDHCVSEHHLVIERMHQVRLIQGLSRRTALRQRLLIAATPQSTDHGAVGEVQLKLAFPQRLAQC